MRHLPARLLEHQAFVGCGDVDSAADQFLSQTKVVPLRVVPEERQHEAVLPAR